MFIPVTTLRKTHKHKNGLSQFIEKLTIVNTSNIVTIEKANDKDGYIIFLVDNKYLFITDNEYTSVITLLAMGESK